MTSNMLQMSAGQLLYRLVVVTEQLQENEDQLMSVTCMYNTTRASLSKSEKRVNQLQDLNKKLLNKLKEVMQEKSDLIVKYCPESCENEEPAEYGLLLEDIDVEPWIHDSFPSDIDSCSSTDDDIDDFSEGEDSDSGYHDAKRKKATTKKMVLRKTSKNIGSSDVPQLMKKNKKKESNDTDTSEQCVLLEGLLPNKEGSISLNYDDLVSVCKCLDNENTFKLKQAMQKIMAEKAEQNRSTQSADTESAAGVSGNTNGSSSPTDDRTSAKSTVGINVNLIASTTSASPSSGTSVCAATVSNVSANRKSSRKSKKKQFKAAFDVNDVD